VVGEKERSTFTTARKGEGSGGKAGKKTKKELPNLRGEPEDQSPVRKQRVARVNRGNEAVKDSRAHEGHG